MGVQGCRFGASLFEVLATSCEILRAWIFIYASPIGKCQYIIPILNTKTVSFGRMHSKEPEHRHGA